MSSSRESKLPHRAIDTLRARFLTLLPTIVSIARFHFRHVHCPDRKEDCISEAVALSWSWHIRLAARGRDPANFVVTFARLAARAVGSGRRLCGKLSIRDLMSPACRQRKSLFIARLPDAPDHIAAVFQQALADNTQSPVPVQVQFRSDFPAWKQRLPVKKQQVVEQLALGHRTQDVAQVFGVSAARVSQMRGELHRDYLQFLSDAAAE
jgi:hypothetical protein